MQGTFPPVPPQWPSPLRILQTKRFGLIVVGEDLRIASPADYRIQRFFGRRVAQIILQFLLESNTRRAMAGAFVEHALDVLGQWHRRKQVMGKNLLARLCVEVREVARRGAEQNVSLADFRKPQIVKEF